MVCDDVKRIVYFFLDGELGAKKATDLQQHVDECKDCGDRVTIHKRLRNFIRRKLRSAAPARLRDRILLAVKSQS